jgi:hypothetical protein
MSIRRARRRKVRAMQSGRHSIFSSVPSGISPGSVLSNWAALVALWALPYLTLLNYLHIDAAQSEALQWLLVAIGASGVASILFTAWRRTRDPSWRAKHGFKHGLANRGR